MTTAMGDEWDGGERRADVSLSDVHAGIVEVAGAMQELAEAITTNTKRSSVAQTVWLALLTLGMAFLSIVAVANYSSIQDGHRTGDLIADCTTPDGACFKRGQESQARAIEQIRRDTDAAAERAVRQVECDAGIVCLPGYVPVQDGTTTTTTTVPAVPSGP